MNDVANTDTTTFKPDVANVTVSNTGSVTTTFEPAPEPPPPPPPAEPKSTTTTVIATDTVPSDVNANLSNWLAASADLLDSLFGAVGQAISDLVKSIPDNDEVRSKRDAIALIKRTRGVDDERAEAIYTQYLRDQRTATPKDIVQNTLKRDL